MLDPRKCIAYLTIEHAGAFDESLREQVGEHVFGCDVCQDVCPFNRTRPAPEATTRPFAPREAWKAPLATLLDAREDGWGELSRGTPLRRASAARLVRNALTVVANQRRTEHLPTVDRLAREHADEGVRSHASWAAGKLRGSEAEVVQPGSPVAPSGRDRS